MERLVPVLEDGKAHLIAPHDLGSSLDSTPSLAGTDSPIFSTCSTLESAGHQAGIMADRIHSNGNSKRRIIQTMYDFRRHLSILLDVEILVISSKLLTLHCAPVLETLIASPHLLYDFQVTGKNGRFLPVRSSEERARTQRSSLKELTFFYFSVRSFILWAPCLIL